MSTTQATGLAELIDRISPEAVGVPPQAWHAKKGHKAILLWLIGAPRDSVALQEKFGSSKQSCRDYLFSKLRHLRSEGLLGSRRNYPRSPSPGVRRERTGQLPATWWLIETGVQTKAAAAFEPQSAIDQLTKDQREAIVQLNWERFHFNDHEAWRGGELLSHYAVNPKITARELAKLLVADVTTVRKWRRTLLEARFLKPRIRRRRDGKKLPVIAYEPNWERISQYQSPKANNRMLAPQRATIALSQRLPKLDRRTDEEREWCEFVTPEQVGLTPYEWGCFKVLWANNGTVRETTYEQVTTELGCATPRSIHRIMPTLKEQRLYTIEPKTGGDTGRKSTWTVNAKKVGAAFSAAPKPGRNGHEVPTRKPVQTPPDEVERAAQQNQQSAIEWSGPRSPTEWCKRLGIALSTWRVWVRNGRIRVKKITTKSVRVALADLEGVQH